MTECPVCWEFSVETEVLPCKHTMCITCATSIKKADTITKNNIGEKALKCPLCRVVVQPTYEELVDKVNAMKQHHTERYVMMLSVMTESQRFTVLDMLDRRPTQRPQPQPRSPPGPPPSLDVPPPRPVTLVGMRPASVQVRTRPRLCCAPLRMEADIRVSCTVNTTMRCRYPGCEVAVCRKCHRICAQHANTQDVNHIRTIVGGPVRYICHETGLDK